MKSGQMATSQTVPAPPDPATPPFALVVRSGNALRLTGVDAMAHRLGLAPGMALADARARCPALITQPADPAMQERALTRLVVQMQRFTPMVSADPPDGILLDITGCAHLFDGEQALAQQAMALSARTARHAFGPNAVAARALARHGGSEDTVETLPVAALDLPDEALAALNRAGLRRIGDLSRRPMPALAARFGAETVTRLRQILGQQASPIAPHRITPPLRFEVRFADPLIRTDDALDAIEDLLVQAARAMDERALGGRHFAVTLCRSDNARRHLAVETSQPERQPGPILRLLRERIETLADPLDPGFGFDSITLAVTRTDPLPPSQSEMDSTAQDRGDSLAALIDRLSVRFGPDRVHRLIPCNRHVPERAQKLEPAIETQGKAAQAQGWSLPADQPPRPLLLFDPPQAVMVMAGVPDGPPLHFRWQGQLHEVRLAEGPERIAAEWWRKHTGHLASRRLPTRDYYRVEDSEGRRYWMFRHGLFEETPDPRWYLHGLFA